MTRVGVAGIGGKDGNMQATGLGAGASGKAKDVLEIL